MENIEDVLKSFENGENKDLRKIIKSLEKIIKSDRYKNMNPENQNKFKKVLNERKEELKALQKKSTQIKPKNIRRSNTRSEKNIKEYIPGTIEKKDENDMIDLLNEICFIRDNEQKVANMAREDTITKLKDLIQEKKEKDEYKLVNPDIFDIKKRDKERNIIKKELDNILKNSEYKNDNKRRSAKKDYLNKIKSLNGKYNLITKIENETYRNLRLLKDYNASYKMELYDKFLNIESGYKKQEWPDFVSSFIEYYKNTYNPICKELLKSNYESLYRYLGDSSNRNIFGQYIFGGAKKKPTSKGKSVKKSTTKRKSTKKSTTKRKSTKKSRPKKKSVKKSTTKKVSDKRLGMYKHKGHTHRTKKALKACTK